MSEHEAPAGPKWCAHPCGQSRHHRPTIRGDPAFNGSREDAGSAGLLVSLDPRAGIERPPRAPAPRNDKGKVEATPGGPVPRRRLGGLLHAARFASWRPLQPAAQSLRERSVPRPSDATSSCNTLAVIRPAISGRHRRARIGSRIREKPCESLKCRPAFCPCDTRRSLAVTNCPSWSSFQLAANAEWRRILPAVT